jgi:hypothetical protein
MLAMSTGKSTIHWCKGIDPVFVSTPFGVLIVVVLDKISHTKKILNMFCCSTHPTNFMILLPNQFLIEAHVFVACLTPGIEPWEENASDFLHSTNASLRSGERQLTMHSPHKARTTSICAVKGIG